MRRRRVVAIINSGEALRRATRMRTPPDFFELRLDALVSIIDELGALVPRLHARLLIAARHPVEGGVGNLTASERRSLLSRFLPRATAVDVELRSKALIPSLRIKRTQLVLSFHELAETPPVSTLLRKMELARGLGAEIFKVATRVNDHQQLRRLLEFYAIASQKMPIAAMGIGKLGRLARIELLRRGSVLNYGYIDLANAEGQMSLRELRRLLPAKR